MTPKEMEELIEELDKRVERLRALYDQYFLGIERIEPSILRKDVERRFFTLRREKIRNTAVRYRFQQLCQRYTTYQTFWQRVARQIEEGTYRRDVMKVRERLLLQRSERREERRRKAGLDPQTRDEPEDDGIDVEVEVDEGSRPGVPLPLAAAPVPEPPPEPIQPAPAAPAGPPVPERPQRPVGKAPEPQKPVRAPLPVPQQQPARPQVETGEPSPQQQQKPAAPPPVSAPKRPPPPPPTALRPPPEPPKAAPPPAASPPPAVVAPPAVATSPQAVARPPAVAPVAPPAPRPAPPAAGDKDLRTLFLKRPRPSAGSADDPGPSEDRMRAIYDQYRTLRRENNEGDVAFESVKKSIREMIPKLREKAAGRPIDFEVVVKDGKTMLKPKAK